MNPPWVVRPVVHRQGNSGSDPNQSVIFRVGQGDLVLIVDGPERRERRMSKTSRADRREGEEVPT
jgi:hypothetical protein